MPFTEMEPGSGRGKKARLFRLGLWGGGQETTAEVEETGNGSRGRRKVLFCTAQSVIKKVEPLKKRDLKSRKFTLLPGRCAHLRSKREKGESFFKCRPYCHHNIKKKETRPFKIVRQ